MSAQRRDQMCALGMSGVELGRGYVLWLEMEKKLWWEWMELEAWVGGLYLMGIYREGCRSCICIVRYIA